MTRVITLQARVPSQRPLSQRQDITSSRKAGTVFQNSETKWQWSNKWTEDSVEEQNGQASEDAINASPEPALISEKPVPIHKPEENTGPFRRKLLPSGICVRGYPAYDQKLPSMPVLVVRGLPSKRTTLTSGTLLFRLTEATGVLRAPKTQRVRDVDE